MSERRTLVAGNWKMNLGRGEATRFCRALVAGRAAEPGCDVALFPAAPLLAVLEAELAGSGVSWGGQDLHPRPAGAHTGDVSAGHIRDWGSRWVLCGHSERRQDHAESDDLVSAKVTAALDGGLGPILCVGETEVERREERTEEVLSRQLDAAVPRDGHLAALAYEPVWAIGTGLTATPQIAQEAHAHLRRRVAELTSDEVASSLRILYGGSVRSENCEALLEEVDIDGFLIGGASLDSAGFLDIIRRCGASS